MNPQGNLPPQFKQAGPGIPVAAPQPQAGGGFLPGQQPAPNGFSAQMSGNVAVPVAQPAGVPVAQSNTAGPVPAPNAPVAAAEEQGGSVLKLTIAEAKATIARTAQDPFEQARQLEVLKAKYLRDRFGLDVRVSDGQS